MTFAVAMSTDSGVVTTVPVADAPTWANANTLDDDTALTIARRAEDGNQADQDVFVFTPGTDASGLLSHVWG